MSLGVKPSKLTQWEAGSYLISLGSKVNGAGFPLRGSVCMWDTGGLMRGAPNPWRNHAVDEWSQMFTMGCL